VYYGIIDHLPLMSEISHICSWRFSTDADHWCILFFFFFFFFIQLCADWWCKLCLSESAIRDNQIGSDRESMVARTAPICVRSDQEDQHTGVEVHIVHILQHVHSMWGQIQFCRGNVYVKVSKTFNRFFRVAFAPKKRECFLVFWQTAS
jgi:hypothetical protein